MDGRSSCERCPTARLQRGVRRDRPHRSRTLYERIRIPSVGFIGLGVMGEPMAGHLAGAGHPLQLFDAAPGVAARLAATLPRRGRRRLAGRARRGQRHRRHHGAERRGGARARRRRRRPAAGLRARRAAARHLFVGALADRADGRGAARARRRDGRRAGLGRASGARRRRSWCSWSAAPPADLERVRPLLAAMGKAVFHVGGLGAGHAMKCLNNLITSVNLLAAERRPGDGQALRASIRKRWSTCSTSRPGCRGWRRRTSSSASCSRRFDDPFKLALMVKDIGIAMALARATGTPAPPQRAAQQLWRAAADAARPTPASASWCAGSSGATGTEISAGAGAEEAA